MAVKGSPPLARGIPRFSASTTTTARITPACAGNTHILTVHHTHTWDHPRLRGEYSSSMLAFFPMEGSPPLARGIPICTWKTYIHHGITPACAGNTLIPLVTVRPVWDHPRLRGEYCPSCIVLISSLGSPPLARGILCEEGTSRIKRGITPACAGNTWASLFLSGLPRDHPRLRGEYNGNAFILSRIWGSPPLARGIPLFPS